MVAPGVELYVAKVDLKAKMKKGMTIGLDGEKPDGWWFGEVAYVEGKVHFHMDQVELKPRGEWTTEDVTEQHNSCNDIQAENVHVEQDQQQRCEREMQGRIREPGAELWVFRFDRGARESLRGARLGRSVYLGGIYECQSASID